MGDLYDGAFRTLLNDCRQLVIPLINEIFDEHYKGDELIEFYPNEHFIDQQDAPDLRRITDTSFAILGSKKKNYHLECESGNKDGRIAIRLFEYDGQIALDGGSVTKETLTVTFPHTAVLYLRSKKTMPDQMRYVIHTPGGTVEYDIPVIKMQKYSLDELFEKQLLMLIPFYIFTHENRFKEYNNDKQELAKLQEEYQKIRNRLEELEQQERIGAFDKRVIMDISGDVIEEIARDYEQIQKGVGDLMRGTMIETEAHRILYRGIEEGRKEGKLEGRKEEKREIALRMLKTGRFLIDEIAEYSGLEVTEIEQLARS